VRLKIVVNTEGIQRKPFAAHSPSLDAYLPTLPAIDNPIGASDLLDVKRKDEVSIDETIKRPNKMRKANEARITSRQAACFNFFDGRIRKGQNGRSTRRLQSRRSSHVPRHNGARLARTWTRGNA